jgi:hypothetical protein
VAPGGQRRVRQREVLTVLEPRQDRLRQAVVQRRQRRGQVGQVAQHRPGVLVRDPTQHVDVLLQRDRGPGRLAPALLVRRQSLLPVDVDVGLAELAGPGQLGQRLLQRLGWAVHDVEQLQRPGLGDRQDAGDRADHLPQLDHDRVAAGQRRGGIDQRAGPRGGVGEQVGHRAGQVVDVLSPAGHHSHPSGSWSGAGRPASHGMAMISSRSIASCTPCGSQDAR